MNIQRVVLAIILSFTFSSSQAIMLSVSGVYEDETVLTGGLFTVTNSSDAGVLISSITINLDSDLFFDTDPSGDPGPPVTTASGFDFHFDVFPPGGSEALTGAVLVETGPGPPRVAEGSTSLTINFSDFDSGESLEFGIDVDILGASSGFVGGAGFEGSQLVVTFTDGFGQRTLRGTYLQSDGFIAETSFSADVPEPTTLLLLGLGLAGLVFARRQFSVQIAVPKAARLRG